MTPLCPSNYPSTDTQIQQILSHRVVGERCYLHQPEANWQAEVIPGIRFMIVSGGPDNSDSWGVWYKTRQLSEVPFNKILQSRKASESLAKLAREHGIAQDTISS